MDCVDRNVQAPDTPVGVQDGSSVNGSCGASIEAPSTARAELDNGDRIYVLRRGPRKKRDPRFVYSEDLLLIICVIFLVWDRLLLYKGGSVHNDFDDSTVI